MKLETPTSGSELTARSRRRAGNRHKAVPPTFVRDLFGRVPPEDLAPYSPQRSRTSQRQPTSISRRPARPEAPTSASSTSSRARGPAPGRDGARGRQRQHALPARFDAGRDRRRGLRAAARRPPDPGGGARRDRRAGAPRRRGRRQPRRPGVQRESFIHIHLPASTIRRPAHAPDRGHARTSTRTWRVAVRDWPGMRGRSRGDRRRTTASTRRRCRPTRSREAVAFLDWIAQRQLHLPGIARIPPAGRRHRRRSGRGHRASASCAIPPCGCCGAGANSSR